MACVVKQHRVGGIGHIGILFGKSVRLVGVPPLELVNGAAGHRDILRSIGVGGAQRNAVGAVQIYAHGDVERRSPRFVVCPSRDECRLVQHQIVPVRCAVGIVFFQHHGVSAASRIAGYPHIEDIRGVVRGASGRHLEYVAIIIGRAAPLRIILEIPGGVPVVVHDAEIADVVAVVKHVLLTGLHPDKARRPAVVRNALLQRLARAVKADVPDTESGALGGFEQLSHRSIVVVGDEILLLDGDLCDQIIPRGAAGRRDSRRFVGDAVDQSILLNIITKAVQDCLRDIGIEHSGAVQKHAVVEIIVRQDGKLCGIAAVALVKLLHAVELQIAGDTVARLERIAGGILGTALLCKPDGKIMIQLRLAAVCILQGVEPQHIVRLILQTADAEG